MGCPVYSNQSQLPTVHCSTKKKLAVSPLCPNSYIVSTVKLYFTILLLSFKDRVLPTIIFPIFTALAFKLLFGRIAAAGLTEQLGTHCRTTPEFTPQIFTGVPAIDQTLCPLVTFFNTLMHDDTGMSFLTYVEACLAGAGNTGRVTQQADRTELYWGRRDEDVVQGQDLNYRTRRRMPVYVRCDLCDDVIRRAALHSSQL